MRVLFIGDIVGEPGMSAVKETIEQLMNSLQPDVIIANGENSAKDGRGINRPTLHALYQLGIDVVTLGNHSWHHKEIFDFIEEETQLIRPANFPPGTPGRGYVLWENDKYIVGICNLMGRSFLPPLDCPFRKMDEILDEIRTKTRVIIVDFHAEASAEKIAMAWYVDGRVSAVLGTHTHVQTADERILPNGTAYISDVGMVGPYDGIIGIERDTVLTKFLTQLPVRFRVQEGRWQFNAVIVDIDYRTGKATRINRIRIDDEHPWLD